MEGVVNTIKEFSDDFNDLYNSWKYVVEEDDCGISIKHMEMNDGKWEETDSFNISLLCAEKLFKEVAKSFDNGEFGA